MKEHDKEVLIKVEDLHKSFGELEVLKGIDEEIADRKSVV